MGRESARRLALTDRLGFECSDIRHMSVFNDQSFELVVANNSLLYLASRDAAAAGLRELQRVLVRGGALLIYQTNRWRVHEPFTKAPIVHLLPASLAEAVSRRTGWQHSHGRVRLSSPGQMRRQLSSVGFQPVGTMSFGRNGAHHTRPVLRNFGTWYAQAARRRD